MSNPNGNPGNKGGGRKPLYDEIIKAKVINKSWDFLLKIVEDEKAPRDDKLKIAMVVCPKTIKTEVDTNLKSDQLEKIGYGLINIARQGKEGERPNPDVL